LGLAEGGVADEVAIGLEFGGVAGVAGCGDVAG